MESEAARVEREAIVRYLREGGTRDSSGTWWTWDSEMRSYANDFADDIQYGRHHETLRTGGWK